MVKICRGSTMRRADGREDSVFDLAERMVRMGVKGFRAGALAAYARMDGRKKGGKSLLWVPRRHGVDHFGEMFHKSTEYKRWKRFWRTNICKISQDHNCSEDEIRML
jgi:hypothetical protein